ncbi:MAG: type I restriction enzyme HsdR N-terminal domain-containing protein [Chitinophagaceae bacterium]|nr:type I restriction enzyme HsdR N-terminal domain-containing protein [Chitinophagaceae bacterium]
MIQIEYPDHHFRMKEEGGKEFIFDEIRRSWLRLTPEEWVRQNFVQYLLQVKRYPSSLLALEKRILVGELFKRFDILVYDRRHQPWMLIECKAMEVPLSGPTLEQVLRYNIAVPVPYLTITNGNACVVFQKKDDSLSALPALPDFAE